MDQGLTIAVSTLIKSPKVIFWDFDGVIKDSVDTKTEALVELFEQYGPEVTERVRKHHEANGGMSRFEKVPLYLRWAGTDVTRDRVSAYCDRFSQLVAQRVIDSPWVPGVENYLRSNCRRQMFLLTSATPQVELERILRAIGIEACFAGIFGAPIGKKEAIDETLHSRAIAPDECLMIGDARADLDAAWACRVPFLLRRHGSNVAVFAGYEGPSINDFTEL
jgi:phosphoglycolate phosphatase-like HAD superfamily hydrolase